jgi:hypothetical protein
VRSPHVVSVAKTWVETQPRSQGKHCLHMCIQSKVLSESTPSRPLSLPCICGIAPQGFRYLKLDFLYCAALPGHRFDRDVTRAQAMHTALRIMRAAAGEGVFLMGCSVPVGSAVVRHPPPYSGEKGANRDWISVGDRSRGCYLYTATRWYRRLHVQRWGLGFVYRSRTIFCRAVPDLSVTMRNVFIAVPPSLDRRSARPPTSQLASAASFTPPPTSRRPGQRAL